MTPSRDCADHLGDILDAIEKAGRFARGMTLQQFENDEKTAFAVIRALEIIGESTKRIPSDLRDRFPNVPRREMAAMGDNLIHDYSRVNLEVVWRTLSEDLPRLEQSIRQIVAGIDE